MGNGASAATGALKVATYTTKANSMLKSVTDVSSNDKARIEKMKEEAPTKHREMEQRHKERLKEYEKKRQERKEKTKSLTKSWHQNRNK
eukprot:CAMPEP_0184863270 /NCGR_PEP_ID=MMETSP0580-20130426/10371_1 /TAXON_ID=1118495 /ORGANISM="Dactyliosolen fragilissimus" /LENGTH=88 /DNA_ID=CAMNT_0027361519 /DNA_START=61 /DNA_END=327 /DNA_ORIENTATION=-